MPTPHPPAAILTGAEGDPKLADEDPRDRQFLLELGGHTGRAHLSAAIGTARRQRYVVADVYPGRSAAAGRLAVLGAGSTAGTLGFGRDGLGEGSRLAITGASRCIELSFQAGVLPLKPFDPPVQPFAFALAFFEFALHARVLFRRRPGGVLLVACRAHTPFIGTCAILCTPDVSHRRLPRLTPRLDGCHAYRRGNQLHMDQRLIEVAFPLELVSLDSVHEKNVRQGHISTLHIWPARRPLAASRAALIATLLPDPGGARERQAVYRRMAGEVVETVEDERVGGWTVARRKRETQGGILHWKREGGPDVEWFRARVRDAFGGRAAGAGRRHPGDQRARRSHHLLPAAPQRLRHGGRVGRRLAFSTPSPATCPTAS